MKTLKKTLCLILAVVMVVGVLILPANAASIKDYKDNEDIKYKEAVEVLSGLGILGGKDTGYFAPKGTLTRAEAAKIIAWMLLGEDAEKLHSNTQIFADVAADNWAAGYIAFCKNEGILAGDGAGNFRPNGELNGVDFGKMLLTALGYDAKLEGYVLNKDWDKNVTTQMLNKNSYIDIGTVLSNPMTREEAAQMAFLALQQSTVKYPATIFGTSQYVLTGTTLGASFGLERVKGVMTANEYADLNSSQPASNGKSVIGGETYNYASDLTEIGLYYEGWACGTGTRTPKTIIHLDAVGNTVWENHGVATSLDNFRQVTGMNDASVGYINFGETTFNYIADIRIVYDVDGEGPEDQVIIRANDPISNTQFAEMRDIFDKSQEEGWIAVGTVDVDDTNDLSDTISWSTFRSRYLTTNDRIGVDVTGADQGEWLKVIDNNRDGKADYVFLTTFTMTTVTGVAKNGDLTLDNGTKDGLIIKKYATSADLAVGDVVIYTTIDETTYVEPAPSFTGKVDKYTYKTEVLTVEGEDYPQSEIDGAAVMFNAGYYTENEDAAKNTEYTYYQDFFGNIRAFEEPAAATNSLVLLTDGWYRVTKSNDEYAVRAYLDDEIGVYDVNNRAVGAFIGPTTVTDNNSWGNLKAFRAYSAPRYQTDTEVGKTNLARYSADEDGVLSLSSAKTYIKNGKNKDIKIATDYVELTKEDLKAGQRTYNGTYEKIAADKALVADTGSVKVQATKDTVFYYVWTDTVSGNKVVKSVIAVTGYANAYAVKNQINSQANILKAYAVARNTDADAGKAPYWVAEAIVIETEYAVVNGANNMVFGYNVLNKTVRDFGDLESVLPTGELGDLEVKTIDGLDPVNYNAIDRTGTIPNPAFYLSSGTEGEVDINTIDKSFGSYGIYTALIDRKVALKDYIVTTDGTELSYNENNVIVYQLSENSKRTANLITHEDSRGDLELEVNEYYILVADARGNIVYAILVDNIGVTDGAVKVQADLNKDKDPAADLFKKIFDDAQPKAENISFTNVKVNGADVADPYNIDVTYTAGQTLTVAFDSNAESVGATRTIGSTTAAKTFSGGSSTWTLSSDSTGITTAGGKVVYTIVLAKGTDTLTKTITVNVLPQSNNARAKTITVKGSTATPVAGDESVGGMSDPFEYEVYVTYANNNNKPTSVKQIEVVTEHAGANVDDTMTDTGTTGIGASYNTAKDADTALTQAGKFTFSITAEDGSTKLYYEVEIKTVTKGQVTLTGYTPTGANLGTWTASNTYAAPTVDYTFTVTATSGYRVDSVKVTCDGAEVAVVKVDATNYKIVAAEMAKYADKTLTLEVKTTAVKSIKLDGSHTEDNILVNGVRLDETTGVTAAEGEKIIVTIPTGNTLRCAGTGASVRQTATGGSWDTWEVTVGSADVTLHYGT